MLNCPHCRQPVRMRELPHPGWFKNYRVCPHCGERFAADSETQYRQAVCLLVAVVALGLTLPLYVGAMEWLIPALVSYAVLGLIIYWGNKRMFLVPYTPKRRSTGDG